MKEDRFSEMKDRTIKSLKDDIRSSKSIALVGIDRVPSKQFQQIRKSLRGKAKIKVVKKTMLKRAFDGIGIENITEMESYMDGPVATIFSKENSFKLYKEIDASRARAPAKGGETAQEDVFLEAKATNLKPGPVVGELQKAGIPASIDQGRIIIRKDTLLVKKGDKISREKALALSKLEILPLEIGLDFRASFEDGLLFKRDMLAVSAPETIVRLVSGHGRGLALALHIKYYTGETTRILIGKAFSEANGLSLTISYPTRSNIGVLLAKGKLNAESVQGKFQKGE